MTTATKLRIVLGAIGVGTLAFGVHGLLTEHYIRYPQYVGQWLVAGVILHDAVLAPVVFVLCAVVYRFTRPRLRGRLGAVLLIGGSLTLVALPGVLRKGHNPNPTVQPLDYSHNLEVVLLLLVAGLVLATAVDAVRDRRKTRRQAATVPATPEVRDTTDTTGSAAVPDPADDAAAPTSPSSPATLSTAPSAKPSSTPRPPASPADPDLDARRETEVAPAPPPIEPPAAPTRSADPGELCDPES